MGIVSELTGGAAGGIIGGIGKILDDTFTNDEERAKAEIAMRKIEQAPFMANLEIDKVEASHASIFVAGARPALKWVIAIGVAYEVIIRPLLAWVTGVISAFTDVVIAVPPSISLGELIALMGGGGALYAARSWEGVNGKKRDTI